MMAISGVEVVAGAAWALGVAVVVWGVWVHRVLGCVALLLLVVVTMVPLLGPVAAAAFVLRKRAPLGT
jgi:hypothetical protein